MVNFRLRVYVVEFKRFSAAALNAGFTRKPCDTTPLDPFAVERTLSIWVAIWHVTTLPSNRFTCTNERR
jgi:hypothetical protein